MAIRVDTHAVPINRGPMAGAFKARITVYENGRRLWSETHKVAYIHRHHAIEAAKSLATELLTENDLV